MVDPRHLAQALPLPRLPRRDRDRQRARRSSSTSSASAVPNTTTGIGAAPKSCWSGPARRCGGCRHGSRRNPSSSGAVAIPRDAGASADVSRLAALISTYARIGPHLLAAGRPRCCILALVVFVPVGLLHAIDDQCRDRLDRLQRRLRAAGGDGCGASDCRYRADRRGLLRRSRGDLAHPPPRWSAPLAARSRQHGQLRAADRGRPDLRLAWSRSGSSSSCPVCSSTSGSALRLRWSRSSTGASAPPSLAASTSSAATFWLVAAVLVPVEVLGDGLTEWRHQPHPRPLRPRTLLSRVARRRPLPTSPSPPSTLSPLCCSQST